MQTPNDDMQTPNTGMQTPNDDMQTPNTGMQTPNDDMQTPNTGMQTPNTGMQTLNTDMQTPNTDMQTPNTDMQTPNDDIHDPSESSESEGERDDAYYDSYFGGYQDRPGYVYPSRSPTPPPICSEERHPHTLFSVDPWSSHNIEYGGKILVIARNEEECCDILYQEYGGHRSEIECRVRYADTLWLASSNMSSGIWQKILH